MPGEAHWSAVKSILKYLKRTKDMFLIYGGGELILEDYSDASFQSDDDDAKFQSGFVFKINASEAAKEAVWMKNYIQELGMVPSIAEPVVIFCDNNGAIAQAKEPRSHHRSKHILRRYHLLMEMVSRGLDLKRSKLRTSRMGIESPVETCTKSRIHWMSAAFHRQQTWVVYAILVGWLTRCQPDWTDSQESSYGSLGGLVGRELSIPRAGRVAGHELAGCELASSLACRSRASQIAGRELADCELAWSQAASSRGASSPAC
ncbi:UNVERIFIED_CONTAM: hypothetical protein Slati_1122400 [Sesamum latifolium]|uniref:Uncharacterized protein n=1 Tax=Sesamum latifolium TaxID=2727402 RepID=A0AAW2XCQ4_9LAMI